MQRRGFTLIELLVVVAVLAILAAIALPNFLEAQVRSKVSRVLADLNTLRVATEAYAVDANRYPRLTWGRPPFYDVYTGLGRTNEPIFGTHGYWLTTPIAYTTRFDITDPFTRDKNIGVDGILYTYYDRATSRMLHEQFGELAPHELQKFDRAFGEWMMLSLGPDGSNVPFWVQYDPTNGSVSAGNIVRSQRSFDPGPNVTE